MYFQDIIFALQKFWGTQGCSILQPCDTEVGAGTLNPLTAFKTITHDNWNVAYVQASRRPADSRYGENPNRLHCYYQFQVIMKPSPQNIQDLCIESFKILGLDPLKNDIRFVEDDWENPSIGASGLGWEMWCNGMEILQFTYMQQIGGIELSPIPVELTYGLERVAMYLQNVSHFKDIIWNDSGITYGEIFMPDEKQFSAYVNDVANVEMLKSHFKDTEKESINLLEHNLPLPAFYQCLKASHMFNILDARNAIGATDRAYYLGKLRTLAKSCIESWVKLEGKK